MLGGANCDFFDLDPRTRQWYHGGIRELPAIDTDDGECLDEVIFSYKSHIYMLLYVHFGKLQLHSLHVFDKEERTWEQVEDFGPIQGFPN